jgi:TPR repeat protein
MNGRNNFALVRKPSGAVEKVAPGAKHILSGMVADTIALIAARANAEAQGWFEKGNSFYFESENYTEAVRWYRKAAEQNHAEAQYALGYCYENGEGVDQDYSEAVIWYRKAAGQNFAPAQYNLADCYRRGDGVSENMEEAVQWYRKAAEQGDADAQYKLGMCYQYGQGVVKDEAEAEKWQDKAREKWRKDAEEKIERKRIGADF